MLDWMCLIFASIAFYLVLNNLGYFVSGFRELLRILSPFAGGVVIAFVLNPMVVFPPGLVALGPPAALGVHSVVLHCGAAAAGPAGLAGHPPDPFQHCHSLQQPARLL